MNTNCIIDKNFSEQLRVVLKIKYVCVFVSVCDVAAVNLQALKSSELRCDCDLMDPPVSRTLQTERLRRGPRSRNRTSVSLVAAHPDEAAVQTRPASKFLSHLDISISVVSCRCIRNKTLRSALCCFYKLPMLIGLKASPPAD